MANQGTNQGTPFTLAQPGGAETVALTVNQLPAHSHPLLGSAAGASASTPLNGVVSMPNKNLYRAGTPAVPFDPSSVANAGGNLPHDNFQPYLCVNFIISLFGIFPSTN